MAKDIEQIIAEFVVPEMEYSPEYDKKKKGKTKAAASVTIDEVPEVVLPKTKAEVYREAKGRLKQKTSSVSRMKKKGARSEVAATVTLDNAEPPQKHTVHLVKRPVAEPVWVGGAEELIPFAWRMPLIADVTRPSKYYKQIVREAKELLLPVPHNK